MQERIAEMYMSGMSAPQIAKRIGIGSTTVYSHLRKAGIRPSQLIATRKRNRIGLFTPEQDKEIAELYTTTNLGLKKIAKKYNCCYSAIRNALKREKVKMHPKGNRYREFTEDEIKDIIIRYKSGESQTKIAQVHQSSQIVISRTLRSFGIQPQKRAAKGERHGNWKGGQNTTYSGYEYILIPQNHRFSSMSTRQNYVAKHRLVMAEHLNRPLRSNEIVHHINGVKLDNDIKNLELRNVFHGKGVACHCADCGSKNIIFEELKNDSEIPNS